MPPTARSSTTTTRQRQTEVRSPAQADRSQPVAAKEDADRSRTRTATVRLPFLSARFEVPAPPTGEGWRMGPVSFPSPAKTAYYLGLGTLAVVDVVEWPVALAIAAGTFVGQHTRGQATAIPQTGSAHHDGHQRPSSGS